MSDRTHASFISRRRLFGEAAVAAAATMGLASIGAPSAVQAAMPTDSGMPAQDEAPRLPARILVKGKLPAEIAAQIEAISPRITLINGENFESELPNADVVIGKVAPEQLSTLKKLRWLQVTSVGVDTILSPDFVASSVILTNTRGCSGAPIAETAWAFLLALTRGVGFQAYNRRWEGFAVKQVEMEGLTMGIIGLGGIGREVAKRAQAMEMHVIAVDAEPLFQDRYPVADEIRLVDDGLEDLLQRSDVVMICCPLTRRTRGLIGEKQLSMMKDGSYLINVTRGPIVDTEALLAALRSKKLAGAGLDVTHPEPLPNDHPLWKEPNCIIMPHKAGGSQRSGAREQTLFAENIRRYVHGLPMLNVVDKVKGY